MSTKTVEINGLVFEYTRDRALFNGLLKVNGITKKRFAEKFEMSYSYVNSWGTLIQGKEKPYPSWVFHYLKDILYFKIAYIRNYMDLKSIYNAVHNGKTLSELYISVQREHEDLEFKIMDDFIADGRVISF